MPNHNDHQRTRMEVEPSLKQEIARQITNCRNNGESMFSSVHGLAACLRTDEGRRVIEQVNRTAKARTRQGAEHIAAHIEQQLERLRSAGQHGGHTGTEGNRGRAVHFSMEYAHAEEQAAEHARMRMEEIGGPEWFTAGELMLGFTIRHQGRTPEAGKYMKQLGIGENEMTRALQEIYHEHVSGGSGQKKQMTALEEFGIDLNRLARDEKIGPVVGRGREVHLISETLLRKNERNALLVGRAGVGKTAIVELFAIRLESGEVPEPLKGKRVISVSMGSMMAGTEMRGSFEERIKSVLEEAAADPDIILFVDEAHTIMGAGSSGANSGISLDASNIMKPYLARGDIQMIAATTSDEVQGIERNRAMARRFTRIEVEEPTAAETLEILQGVQKSYETHHKAQYESEALESAVHLADAFGNGLARPCGALQIIDLAGAANRLAEKPAQVLTESDIVEITSRTRSIPSDIVRSRNRGSDEDRNEERRQKDMERLRTLGDEMRKEIFGQDRAIEETCRVIQRHHTGFAEEGRPAGILLFAGPTGVGKTELSIVLARLMGMHFERFDMSEFSQPHTVSGMGGAPPGFVGYHDAMRFTQCVKTNPNSVILLDEIEKAHPDIHNLLLQVMSTGKLTTQNQITADYENVVLIMTTNAGGAEASRRSMGYRDESEQQESRNHRIQARMKEIFSPEFRNRIDRVIHFNSVNMEMARLIARKAFNEIAGQAARNQVQIEASDPVIERLAREGLTPDMGARPIFRKASAMIKDRLVDGRLDGKIAPGHLVRFDEDADGRIVMTSAKAKAS